MFSSVLKHKCSLTEQTLSLLFSHEPIPHQPFSENPKKILACIWDRTQYRNLCSTFGLQSSALTNQPSLDDDNYNVSVRIRNTDCELFIFFSGRHPFVFRDGNGERVLIGEHSHSITPFFLFSLLILPTFYLCFLNIEDISCLEKGLIN